MTALSKLVYHLRNKKITREQFFSETGITSDGKSFALQFLKEAVAKKDRVNVEVGLGLAFEFGFSPEHVDILINLVQADWHISHEDVVSALDDLSDPKAVDALCR